jgi:hypothetical protein
MLRLKIEVPPDPALFAARPPIDYLAQALANRIGVPVTVTATDMGGYAIVGVFDAIHHTRDEHQNAANAVLSAVNGVGLYAVRLLATRTATWAAEWLVTGALGGLGVGAAAKSDLAPWIMLIGGAMGGIFGNAVEREVVMFEWRRDQVGRWYDAQQPPQQLGWGWQPS